MKQQATMAVTGNLRCRSVRFGETKTGGGNNSLVAYATLSDYDTTQAVVMEGDVCVERLTVCGTVIVSGDVMITGEEG